MHRPDQWHDLLPLHPGPLAVLCGEHLRLGAVRLAHGWVQCCVSQRSDHQMCYKPRIRANHPIYSSYMSQSSPDVKCPNYVHCSIIRKLFSPLEKGICLPTVFLWLLFVYIEAAIRLKEYKFHFDTKNLPFHLDLCRPFAAHWWV